MEKLKDWLPWEARDFESVRKYLDCEVVQKFSLHETGWRRWPGTHEYVMNWCVLVNGKVVGFNENPAVGWAFPVIKFK